ncbi:MAG: DUF5715 family protein [Bacteroidales bacterium]
MIRLRKKYIKLSLAGIVLLLLVFTCSKGVKKVTEDKRGPHTIKEFKSGYTRTFGDLNKLHLEAARKINNKIYASEEEADKDSQMVRLKENEYYTIDKLTHSHPYLTKKAANFLEMIGENFQDSLKAKSATPHRVIVTSLLRTHETIKDLRRKNPNSSLNSAHLYGTTFDISYMRFDSIAPGEVIPKQLLKSVLAEVLRDLRKEQKCYVKYEVRQGCFHITTRP